MNDYKNSLLIEIKECTELFTEDNDFKQLIKNKTTINISNVLILSFVEDEFTEELVGYLYDKASKNVYTYLCNFDKKEVKLKLQNIQEISENECRTILVLEEYLSLSQEEIDLLE